MITVTGKIEDSTGAALHARIDFLSQSTPLVGAGIVTTNTDVSIRSNPSDGTFSVQLVPGDYQVQITANGETTSFRIAVPAGAGTASIETLTTTPLLYPFIAPNTVWNEILTGNITVQPLPDPPVVSTTPVVFAGGHQNGTSLFDYRIAWQNATSNDYTNASAGDATNTPPTGANNATRVLLPTPPSGVTATLIFRSNDVGLTRYLLATVAPSVTFYDDWESQADFAARMPQPTIPIANTTAGQIIVGGQTVAAFNSLGLAFPGTNLRVKTGKGAQIQNLDTGLWHTLLCQGNPPQLAVDAGEA